MEPPVLSQHKSHYRRWVYEHRMPRFAITRDVPTSFADALAASPARIDVERARAQHAAYRSALAELVPVVALPADPTLPDCCFIEDTAIVAAGLAVITHPGAASRRGETTATAEALSRVIEIVRMDPPATLDGGDCMRVGNAIYVGRSARTNDAGIARLAEIFRPRGLTIVPIDLPKSVLHLKCVCAPLGPDRITLAEHTLDRAHFGDLAIVPIPNDESYAANVLAIGDAVLVAEGFPRTRESLDRSGFRTITLATTEFRKADGALTCLSIVVDH